MVKSSVKKLYDVEYIYLICKKGQRGIQYTYLYFHFTKRIHTVWYGGWMKQYTHWENRTEMQKENGENWRKKNASKVFKTNKTWNSLVNIVNIWIFCCCIYIWTKKFEGNLKKVVSSPLFPLDQTFMDPPKFWSFLKVRKKFKKVKNECKNIKKHSKYNFPQFFL